MTEHTITITGREQTVTAGADQPMLDAMLRAGVWMPNSCNQGTCGTCKLKVLCGEVDHRESPLSTLTDEDRAAGYALTCQAVAETDVTIEAADAGADAVHHPLVDFTATVTRVDDVAQDTRIVYLRPDQPFEFSAGQSVSLHVPGAPGQRRQYSIASLPTDPEIELHIRREPDGLASDRWAHGSIRVGESVELSGPLGEFVYDPSDTEGGLLLLGGGTGIAPLKGIARAALAEDPAREVIVYHGVRTCAYLYDQQFWADLAAAHPNVSFRAAVSREHHDGCMGYVSDRLLEDLKSCRGMTGYLCGSDRFVDGVAAAAKRRRLAPRRTFRERFTPAQIPEPARA